MKVTERRSRRRGMYVVTAWVCAALVVLTGAAWIGGVAGTRSVSLGRVCASVTGSQLQIAFANQPVERQKDRWYFRNATAAVVMPGNLLRPKMSKATMTVGTQGGAIVAISLRVVTVPLWQLLLMCLIVGGGAWRLSRRGFAIDHCSECGYDLRGLSSGKCPECGGGFVARVMALVRRMIGTRRGAWLVWG